MSRPFDRTPSPNNREWSRKTPRRDNDPGSVRLALAHAKRARKAKALMERGKL